MPIRERVTINRIWKSSVLAALLAAVVLGVAASGCAPEGSDVATEAASESAEGSDWQSLFEGGESLDSWRNPYDWGEAWVENGEIHLRADEIPEEHWQIEEGRSTSGGDQG